MQESSIAQGVFTLKDSDGNILVNVHNMIVEDGRKQIMTNGFPTENLTFFFDNGDELTNSTDTYKSKIENDPDTIKIDIDGTTNTCTCDKTKICYIIGGSISGSDHSNCCSGGLYFKNEDGYKLFSRFTCNPVAIANNKTYMFEYYIYF